MVKSTLLLAVVPLVNALFIPQNAAAKALDVTPEELEDPSLKATIEVHVDDAKHHPPPPPHQPNKAPKKTHHGPKKPEGKNVGFKKDLKKGPPSHPHGHLQGPPPPPPTFGILSHDVVKTRHALGFLKQQIGENLEKLKEYKESKDAAVRTWLSDKVKDDLDLYSGIVHHLDLLKDGLKIASDDILHEKKVLEHIAKASESDEDKEGDDKDKEESSKEAKHELEGRSEKDGKQEKPDLEDLTAFKALHIIEEHLRHDFESFEHIRESVFLNFGLLKELKHEQKDDSLRQALLNKVERDSKRVNKLVEMVLHNTKLVDRALESIKSSEEVLLSIQSELESGKDTGVIARISEFTKPCSGEKASKKGKHMSKKDGKKMMKKGHHDKEKSDSETAAFVAPSDVELIPDQYIIIFKSGHDENSVNSHHSWVESLHEKDMANAEDLRSIVGDVKHGVLKTFNIGEGFRGYVGKFLPGTIEAISKNPLVAAIEQDSIVHANAPSTEKGAPWGLARVSHREPLSLGSFNKYIYDDEGGEGVTAYVVDTGIYIDHKDFEGRAKWGRTVPANDQDRDAHGHGTHCAGTIAGKKYGVAKKANVVAVKVLGSDGSGSMSDVIGGIEFVVTEHNKNKDKKNYKGTTANMSLGGGKSPSLDLSVNAAVNAGVHFAVAAGNENQDACNVSPAGASNPITVGATNMGDARAYFSNWGKCVDIFAPGVQILSAGIEGPESSQTMSGTSMASPHVCGLLTYILSLQPEGDSEYASKTITPAQLKKNLITFGTKDILTGLDSASPNVLAFNGAGESLDSLYVVDPESTATGILHKIESELLENGGEFISHMREAAEAALERIAEIKEIF